MHAAIEKLSDEEAAEWLTRISAALDRPSLRAVAAMNSEGQRAFFAAYPPLVEQDDIDDWDQLEAAHLAAVDD